MKLFRASLLLFFSALVLAAPACGKKGGGPSNIDDLKVDETFTIPGLSAPVDVVRDELDRPHIYGATAADVAMVTGWLHAEDRYIQMDLQRRFASGTVADLVGALLPEAVENDKQLRAIGLRRSAAEIYAALPAGDGLKIALDAYTAGVNARLAAFGTTAPAPEYGIFLYPWAENPPWTAVDSLTVGRLLAYQLSFDGSFELGLAEDAAALQAAFPTGPRAGAADDITLLVEPPVEVSIMNPTLPSAATAAISTTAPLPSAARIRAARALAEAVEGFALNPFADAYNGSNNWVVGGSRSATGHPILANDPHLGLENPAVWYDLHINTARAGGDLDVIGVSLPGLPLVVLGANGKVAWGATTLGADVTDVFVEHFVLNTASGAVQVMWDADGPGGVAPALVPATKLDEVYSIRQGNGTAATITDPLYLLPHRQPSGVIVPGTLVAGTAFSYQYTGFGPSNEVRMFYKFQTAQNAAAVTAAADDFGVGAQNIVYADVDGNFGIVSNALFPIRGDNDGDLHTDPPFLPMPGYDGAHEWTGYVPRTSVPQEQNAARGWQASANQDALGDTFDNDCLNDPIYLTCYYDIGFRGGRIAEVLDGDASVSVADMKALQGDHTSNVAVRFLPFLLESLGTTHPQGVALLQAWADRGFQAESGVGDDVPATEVDDAAATSLFNAWFVAMNTRALDDEFQAAGAGAGAQTRIRTLLRLLERPTESATYDPTTLESALWDDVGTPAVETRDQVFTVAFDDALAWLASGAGFGSSSPDEWRWGLVHKITFERQTGLASYNIPNPADPEFPTGYPRHGDNENVDACNGGINNYAWDYGGGPSMRMVVDLTPGRMRVFNMIPGGVSGDPQSPHFADQVPNWIGNVHSESWLREKDVAKHGERKVRYTP